MQTAQDAYNAVLDDAGATLPARDAVDLRITRAVREGTGRIIEKETDLPERNRWPDYRSLPPPGDADADGMPDFWETQFGFNPRDASDAMQITAGGHANIEHYCNSTNPRADGKAVVSIAATVSRADEKQPGEWRVMRTGDPTAPLTVQYTIGGDAAPGVDFAALPGTITIPAGKDSATLKLMPTPTVASEKIVVVTLDTASSSHHVGCPSASLVVIRKAR